MSKPLRVVDQDERPVRKAPGSLKEAVELSERDLLVATRRKIASEIDSGVPAHALASLVRQLREVDKDIRAIDARNAEEAEDSGAATADEAWTGT